MSLQKHVITKLPKDLLIKLISHLYLKDQI